MAHRVLVTGSGGFIGRHLVARLLSLGEQVFEIRNRSDCDLSDPVAARRRLRAIRPSILIHLAASPDVGPDSPTAELAFRNTIRCAANVLDAVSRSDCAVIHIGSYKQYGATSIPFREDHAVRPDTPYALAKHRAELLVRSWARRAPRCTCLRLGPIYGPGQGPHQLIPRAIDAVIDRTTERLFTAEVAWDPLYIDDAVDAICRCVKSGAWSGAVINVSGGVCHTPRAVLERLAELMGDPSPWLIVSEPRPVSGLGPRPCLGDISRVRSLLGWYPRISLDQGLLRTIGHRITERAMRDPFLIQPSVSGGRVPNRLQAIRDNDPLAARSTGG